MTGDALAARPVGDAEADRTPGVRLATQGPALYFPEIEALRGVAILLVFLTHADGILTMGLGEKGGSVPLVGAFVRSGHTGVSLFFIISGFLLSLPFLVAREGGRRVSLARYFARRALRILPLYYVAVVVASLSTAARSADVGRGLPYLLFLNSVGLAVPLLPFSRDWWSLATEVQFYLLLPLFLRGGKWRLVLLGVCGLAYAAFVTGLWHAPTVNGQMLLSLSAFGRAPLFVFGIGAAWLYSRFGSPLRDWCWGMSWARRGGADAVVLLVLLALGLLLRKVAVLGFWAAESRWPAWHVAESGLWTSVVLLLLLAPVRCKAVVCNPLLQRLGRISYSFYLIHHPLLIYSFTLLGRLRPGRFVSWDVSTVVVVLLVGILGVVLATVTYRLIERPFLSWKLRFE